MRGVSWIAGLGLSLLAGGVSAQSVEFCAERSEERQRWTQERDNMTAVSEQISEILSSGEEAAQAILRSNPQQLDGFITGLNQQLVAARQAFAQASGSERSQIQTMIVYLQAMLDLALDARARAEMGEQANANIGRFRQRAVAVREMNEQYWNRIRSLTDDIDSNRRQFAAMGCEQLLNPRAPAAGLAQVDINGPWQTNLGRMTFTQTGDTVRGTYAGGTVEGVLSSNTLNARWIQNAPGGWFQAGEACPTPYQGSSHWGRLRLRFEVRAGQTRMFFDGRAAQCYDEVDAPRSTALAGIQASD